MAQLPLAIRRDVRDQFEATDSPVQKQLRVVKDTLGLPVNLEISWSLLWLDLEANSTEKGDFVTFVLAYVSSLLDVLNSRLAEEEESLWVEDFLELLTATQSLRISLQTHKSREPSLNWIDGTGLVLSIPSTSRQAPLPSSSTMLSQLDRLFTKSAESTTHENTRSPATESLDGIMTPTSTLTFNSSLPMLRTDPKMSAQSLPNVESLPRPEQLFFRSKLYIISMRLVNYRTYSSSNTISALDHHTGDRLIIQSSHEQPLRLLYDYFTRWTRPNTQDQESGPALNYELVTSAYGHNNCDTLIIEPFHPYRYHRGGSLVNSTLYQCFIEEILSYESTSHAGREGEQGMSWEFRRFRPST